MKYTEISMKTLDSIRNQLKKELNGTMAIRTFYLGQRHGRARQTLKKDAIAAKIAVYDVAEDNKKVLVAYY